MKISPVKQSCNIFLARTGGRYDYPMDIPPDLFRNFNEYETQKVAKPPLNLQKKNTP